MGSQTRRGILPGRPLRSAGMLALAGATTLSNIGTGAHFVAIAWFVVVTSGSGTRTGAVSGLGMLGLACGSLLGGVIVDRIGPRRTSIGADVAAIAPVALLPLLYLVHLLAFWHVLLLAFVGGVLDMAGGTARQVMLPDIARASELKLETANALMQFASNGAFMLLGPVAARVLILTIGPIEVLFLDATTYLLSAAVIGIGIPDLWSPRGTLAETRPAQRATSEPPGAGLRAGLRFISGHGRLVAVLIAASAVSFLVAGIVTVLVPVLGERVFGDPRALSAMVWGLGAGLTAGFLGLSALLRRLSRDSVLRASLALAAAMLWLLWGSRLLVVDVLALSLFGAAIGLIVPLAYALVQVMVPAELLGRVIGLGTAVVFSAAPLGSFLFGAALAWQSLPTVMAICALIMTMVALWAALDPRLRGLDPLFDQPTNKPGRPGTGGRSADHASPSGHPR